MGIKIVNSYKHFHVLTNPVIPVITLNHTKLIIFIVLGNHRNDVALSFGFVTNNVNGYTNQQIFNALQSDVRSIPAFRDRLLQQNGNNQAANVNLLFQQYAY